MEMAEALPQFETKEGGIKALVSIISQDTLTLMGQC